jgi:NDP-sugar pyrophosphorylase family protein
LRRSPGYWKDIGTPREYLEANMDALEGRAGIGLLGREVSPGIWREAGAQAEGAQIEAPVALGAECRLEDGSRVRRCVIGVNAEIGAATRLDRCVVWSGVEVGDLPARWAILTRDCVVWA